MERYLDNWCTEVEIILNLIIKNKFPVIDVQCFPAASVVQRFDIAMQWINHQLVDKCYKNLL